MDMPVRTRPGIRMGRGRAPKRRNNNYRMLLCAALLICLALAILFFALFLGQRGKTKERDEQIKTLTEQTQTLTAEKAQLQQTLDGLYSSAIAALPEPTTANTQSLPDLIPQLTESLYLIRLSDGVYQYLKVPSGILADRLTAYRDAPDYTASAAGSASDWDLWVLYADKVIGMQTGTDNGFVSTDRSTSGAEYTLPKGFSAFAASLFA